MARVLSYVHTISTWPVQCMLDQPVCSILSLARPDWQLQCCSQCTFGWYSVLRLWWWSCAHNCSLFCMCTCSGSPHKVMHLSTMCKYLGARNELFYAVIHPLVSRSYFLGYYSKAVETLYACNRGRCGKHVQNIHNRKWTCGVIVTPLLGNFWSLHKCLIFVILFLV